MGLIKLLKFKIIPMVFPIGSVLLITSAPVQAKVTFGRERKIPTTLPVCVHEVTGNAMWVADFSDFSEVEISETKFAYAFRQLEKSNPALMELFLYSKGLQQKLSGLHHRYEWYPWVSVVGQGGAYQFYFKASSGAFLYGSLENSAGIHAVKLAKKNNLKNLTNYFSALGGVEFSDKKNFLEAQAMSFEAVVQERQMQHYEIQFQELNSLATSVEKKSLETMEQELERSRGNWTYFSWAALELGIVNLDTLEFDAKALPVRELLDKLLEKLGVLTTFRRLGSPIEISLGVLGPSPEKLRTISTVAVETEIFKEVTALVGQLKSRKEDLSSYQGDQGIEYLQIALDKLDVLVQSMLKEGYKSGVDAKYSMDELDQILKFKQETSATYNPGTPWGDGLHSLAIYTLWVHEMQKFSQKWKKILGYTR